MPYNNGNELPKNTASQKPKRKSRHWHSHRQNSTSPIPLYHFTQPFRSPPTGLLRPERLCALPHSSSRYSRISPGWQSSVLHNKSSVEKRMALALPFFRIDRLAMVIPTFSESSVRLIFRLASITSRFTIIMAIRLIPVLFAILHPSEIYARASIGKAQRAIKPSLS